MSEAIRQLARVLYQEHDNTATDTVVNLLTEQILANPILTRDACQEVAEDTLRHIMSEVRREISKQAMSVQPRTFSPQRQRRVAAAVRTAIFSWPMSDRVTKLGEATRELIAADAARYEANSESNQRRAIFLRSLEARLSPGQRVCDALSEEEVEGLLQASKVWTFANRQEAV